MFCIIFVARSCLIISSAYKFALLSLFPHSFASYHNRPSFHYLTFAVCKVFSRFHISYCQVHIFSLHFSIIETMRSYALTAVLISSSLVSSVLGSNIVIPRALQVRQGGDAFIPGTRQGSGTTCVDSFGPNSKLCADSGVCYDSSIGDSCCSEGCKSPSIFLIST